MFLHTSSNIFELLWYYIQYVCKSNSFVYPVFLFSDFSFHSIFTGYLYGKGLLCGNDYLPYH